ncbi:HNH endonuclease [Chitinophaga pollutisoli]|uniref:HNH endonuclease n=1 Tax=Chitinophaga pollutisoli TaxID=3133966 RepID=A0ABZ2YSX7_9BACT
MFQIFVDRDADNNPIARIRYSACDRYAECTKAFHEQYESIVLLPSRKEFRRKLRPVKDRMCRFCGKKSPEVTFKTAAHLIPSFLGNGFLFSDFECDDCNNFHSLFESNLTYYMGMSVPFHPNLSRARQRKVKNFENDLEVGTGIFEKIGPEVAIQIVSDGSGKNHFTIDESGKKLTVNFARKTYVPLLVYKAILKMALSAMPVDYVYKYRRAFAFLMGSYEPPTEGNMIFQVYAFVHPGPQYNYPIGIIWEKKNKDSRMNTHHFQLLFKNYSFQLALPYFDDDLWMYDGQENLLMVAPPCIDKAFAEKFGVPIFQTLNFSNKDPVKGDPQEVTFTFNEVLFKEGSIDHNDKGEGLSV